MAERDLGTGRLVDVVLVNWNSGDDLRDCLASIAAQPHAGQMRAIVVDNNSSDGSASALAVDGLEIMVIHQAHNVGFARAANAGARAGDAPFVLFLNPDARLVADVIANCVAYCDASNAARADIVSPRLVGPDGVSRRSCARRPTAGGLIAQCLFLDKIAPSLFPPLFMNEWDHGETREVDQVMGAFLLMRRSLYDELDGFDERFFLYFEDVDLCARAKSAGARIVHLADAVAEHRGGGSSERVPARRIGWFATSLVRYAGKHFGAASALACLACLLVAQAPIRILAGFVRGDLRAAIGGAGHLAAEAPGLIVDVLRPSSLAGARR